MKKAPGIVIISGLLVLLALRLFGAHPSATTNPERVGLLLGCLALGVMSLITATALWHGSSKALSLFVAWSFTYLATGGAVQFVSDRAPLNEVAIWWVFIGAVLLAVGAHLRYALRQAV
jgi:hypothetical protein